MDAAAVAVDAAAGVEADEGAAASEAEVARDREAAALVAEECRGRRRPSDARHHLVVALGQVAACPVVELGLVVLAALAGLGPVARVRELAAVLARVVLEAGSQVVPLLLD